MTVHISNSWCGRSSADKCAIVFLRGREYHTTITVKCQICKQRESVLHVQQIIGEEHVDLYLCESCAREKGINRSDDTFELSLSQLLTGLFSASDDESADADREACPSCGTRIETLRKEGRLGCPDCYESFASEIRGVQKKLSGSVQHVGKLPGKLKKYKELIIDRNELQSRLDEAVAQEDYETAAYLRDRIRGIDERGRT